MSSHPLDITGILKSRGVNVNQQKKSGGSKKGDKNQLKEKGDKGNNVRIRPEFWNQLNEESRRMLTSRIWKGVDFNPMLAELEDLTKLTEKWLKWAVPTYVNGVDSGPIRDWIDGNRGERDFHYILVGEHLRHLKELRESKAAEAAGANADLGVIQEGTTEATTPPETPTESPSQATISNDIEEDAQQDSADEALDESAELPADPEDESIQVEEEVSPEEPLDVPPMDPEPNPEVHTEAPVQESTDDAEMPPEEEHQPQSQAAPSEEEALPPPQDGPEGSDNSQAPGELDKALEELDRNIQWFQDYLHQRKGKPGS